MANNPDRRKLELIEQLEELRTREPEEPVTGNISRARPAAARCREIKWDDIRRDYVVGKRKQLEDGAWVTEDYSYKEIADKYGVAFYTLKKKAYIDNWRKLRKAYVARLNNQNITTDLNMYTVENYQAEIGAVNACNKLSKVLDHYIEQNFGAILDASEDTSMGDTVDVETHVDIEEITKAIRVAKDIYGLQRTIYENAPKTDLEVIEDMTNSKRKYKNSNEREAAILRLKASLERKLSAKEENI